MTKLKKHEKKEKNAFTRYSERYRGYSPDGAADVEYRDKESRDSEALRKGAWIVIGGGIYWIKVVMTRVIRASYI